MPLYCHPLHCIVHRLQLKRQQRRPRLSFASPLSKTFPIKLQSPNLSATAPGRARTNVTHLSADLDVDIEIEIEIDIDFILLNFPRYLDASLHFRSRAIRYSSHHNQYSSAFPSPKLDLTPPPSARNVRLSGLRWWRRRRLRRSTTSVSGQLLQVMSFFPSPQVGYFSQLLLLSLQPANSIQLPTDHRSSKDIMPIPRKANLYLNPVTPISNLLPHSSHIRYERLQGTERLE